MAGLDYTQQVEGFIVGFLGFIRGFFVTMHDVALRPKRFANRVSAGHSGYLKPYTFLTLATFSSVTITRYALIAAAVAVGGMMKGCEQETYVGHEPPAMKEIMQLPSVETLIYVALPVVLFIVILGKVANAVLLRHVVHKHGSLSALFLFIAGVQQLMLIPILGAAFWVATAKPESLLDLSDSFGPVVTVFGTVIVIGIVFPAASFYRIGRAVEPALDFRLKRPSARAAAFGVVAVLAATLSMAAIGGMAYWLAKDEIQASLTDVPMVAVTYGGLSTDEKTGHPRIAVLLKNNGPDDLWIKNKVTMVIDGGGIQYAGTLTGMGTRNGMLKLPKGTAAANVIELQGPCKDEKSGGHLPPCGLVFAAVDAESVQSKIVSKITAQGENPAADVAGKFKAAPVPTDTEPESVLNKIKPNAPKK